MTHVSPTPSAAARLRAALRPPTVPLTPGQQAHGRRWIIVCSCISVLWGTGVSDRVIGLCILNAHPAATDATLAFFFALGPMMAVLTALASPLVASHGKKCVLAPLYLAGAPFAVLLAAWPSFLGVFSRDAMVAGMACIITGCAACRAMGMAGWFPIINDNVPDEIRGRFFARLRTSWQLVLVAYSAAVGWFLGPQSEGWRFQIVFLVSLAANLAGTAGITRIPEAPLVPPTRGQTFWRTLSEPFRDRSYACFLVFGALYNLAVGMAGPFMLRCLKGTLGAGDNFIVWMDTLTAIGAAASLPLWGRVVDRFGGRMIFTLLIPLLALLNLLWLVAEPANAQWKSLVAAFYVLQGSFIFGVGVGITDMMLGGARKEYQSTYINVAFVLNTLAVGLGPFLGTLVAGLFSGMDAHWGALTLDSNRWVFIMRFLLLLLPLGIVVKLSREHGGYVGEALQRLSAGLLNLLPSLRR
jgi:MFS family permease